MKRWFRGPHRHIWHLDMDAKTIVCKTCGIIWDSAPTPGG